MLCKTFAKHWRYFCIAPLFLTAILTSFLQYNGQSFLRFDVALSYAILIFAGIGCGMLMIIGNGLLRSMIMALFVSFFILSQLHPTTPYPLQYRYILLLLFAFTSTAFYILNRLQVRLRPDTLLVIVFSLYWLGAFFTKPLFNTSFLTTKNVAVTTQENSDLPPYIHIILDEHTSFAAMPYRNSQYTEQLKKNYIQRGFRIYGDAYARENFTIGSFVNFLNFTPVTTLQKYYHAEGENENKLLVNRLFTALAKQGYHLNVVQSTYLDLCNNNDKFPLKYCLTYHFLAFPPEQTPLLTRVAALLNGVFSVLKLGDMLRSSNNTALPLTPASATVRIFPEVQNLLKTARKGNAYFIHLLIPHAPFVFNKACEFVGEGSKVFQGYREQIQCSQKLIDNLLATLATNPTAQNSTVIIHGDHGIRIFGINAKNKKFLTKKNLERTFGVFFAVKSPSLEQGYDNNQLPLDYLLKNILNDSQPTALYDPTQQYVFLRDETSLHLLEKVNLQQLPTKQEQLKYTVNVAN